MHNLLSIFEYILAHAAKILVISLYSLFSAFITLTAILGILLMPFENGLGLADIDNLEIITLFLFSFVSVRHFIRGRQNKISIWKLLSQYSQYATLTFLCVSLILSVGVAIVAIDKGVLNSGDLVLGQDIFYFGFTSVFIIALFSAAPVNMLISRSDQLLSESDQTDKESIDSSSTLEKSETDTNQAFKQAGTE